MIITAETADHGAAIERLLDLTFGIDRHQKSSYRLRDGVPAVSELCTVAVEHDDFGNEELVGTIRFWEVMAGKINGCPVKALLLGPIAVKPTLQGSGLGSKLIRICLNKAAAAGYRSVLLVGDESYYSRFGFSRTLTLGLGMPAPTDPNRFLGLELTDGALAGAIGPVTAVMVEPAMTGAADFGDVMTTDGFPAGGIWLARPN